MGDLQTTLRFTALSANALAFLTSIVILMGQYFNGPAIYLTSPTSGTSVQTAILVLFASSIMLLDKIFSGRYVLNIKFTASCIMLVYLGTILFDHELRQTVDRFLLDVFMIDAPIGTSRNTTIGLIFLMISSASYAVNNRVMSLSFAFLGFIFPTLLMYDFVVLDSGVLGGMSLQTGFMLSFLGISLFVKRMMLEPFNVQLEKSGIFAEVVHITVLGIVLALVAVTTASMLSDSDDHIIPLLVACFIYQHILFNNSTKSAIDLRIIELRKNQLYKEATTDNLTKVGNRMSIKQLLNEYRSIGVRKIGVVLFDIDYFKLVNDRNGHDVGDKVLYQMCRHIETKLRNTDKLIRWGGEEFMIIVPTDDLYELRTVAENIRKSIEETELGGLYITISSGITVGDSIEFDNLVNKADKGLYHSKQNGRNRTTVVDKKFIVYGQETGQFITLREVEEALHNNEFYFEYQPIFDCETKVVVGIEALMRWNKQGTIIHPTHFVDKLNSVLLADPGKNASKLFNMMSNTVRELNGIHETAYMAFNVNITQLEDDDTVTMLIETLTSPFCRDRQIMIEILEVAGSHNIGKDSRIVRNIHRLRDEGFRIALDDFGVEDSNIVRLISLPIDTIKIDKHVTDMINPSDPLLDRAITLLNGISESFNAMGVRSVIIEGVEDIFQVTELAQLGITTHQGWFYAQAGTKEQLEDIPTFGQLTINARNRYINSILNEEND